MKASILNRGLSVIFQFKLCLRNSGNHQTDSVCPVQFSTGMQSSARKCVRLFTSLLAQQSGKPVRTDPVPLLGLNTITFPV